MKNILTKTARGLLLVCAVMIAFSAYAQQININVKRATLESVLKTITQQTGYRFTYTDAIDAKKEVSANASNVAPLEFFKTFFAKNGISYKVSGKIVSLSPQKAASSNTGKHIVKGKVTDENGETIPGAAVKNVTTNAITVSEMDGQYTIAASEGDQLQFSAIGMEDFTVTVGKSDVINAVLPLDIVALDDVVVTGYQTISKERSAGSFNIIKGDDLAIKAINTNSVVDGLEGLTTGLNISRNYGADKYLIRGTTSINSNRSPLFVVDGVPLEESLVEEMISNTDINSITVLKDATAASIWGSQAANGVIVITTKRGRNNQKVQISYNGSFTYYGKPDYDYYNYMDSKTFIKNALEMFDEYKATYPYATVQQRYTGANHNLSYNSSNSPVIWPHEDAMYRHANGLISQEERDSILNTLIGQNGQEQYEKYFMSDRMFTQHNVSLKGGGNKHTYFVSLNYKGDQGIVKDWTNRFTINAYQDFQLASWLKWDITLNANWSEKNGKLNPWYSNPNRTDEDYHNLTNGYSGARYYNLPYNIFIDENGNEIDQSQMILYSNKRDEVSALTGVDMGFYPLQDFNNSSLKTTSSNVRINTGLTINLLKGLRYEGRFQYSKINAKEESFRHSNSYLVREERVMTFNTATSEMRVPNTGGNYYLNNAVTTDWTVRNQMIYDSAFNNSKHQLTALVGTELRAYKATGYSDLLRGYNIQTMQSQDYDIFALSSAISPNPFGISYMSVNSSPYNQTETSLKYFSLYANAAYTYNKKYTLNASVRMDQSNLFGSDPSTQYKPIWSVGAAWRISEEEFLKDANFLNSLTLRASFGYAGNSPRPGTGGKYDILQATSNVRFETPGYNIITPANDMLTWEKTRTVNIGFDAQFINNAIGLSFDYYNKYTSDLIGIVNLNPTSGWLSTIGNLGELSNKGIEVSLTTNNIRSKNFNWQTILTMSHNKNKIEKLDRESPLEYASQMVGASHIEGYPMGAMFSYKYAGLDSDGKPQAYDKDGNIVKGYDTNYLTKDDVIYSGSSVPKFYGGLTNRMSFKNLEISFMFVYNFGAKMRKDGIQYYGRSGVNLINEFDKRWRTAGDENFTDIPRYTVNRDQTLNESIYQYADTRVLDASYIKLRDISLSYSLPQTICNKVKVEGIKITASAGNLFLIPFNRENIDPEAYYFGGSYSARREKFGPSYSFGLNINF